MTFRAYAILDDVEHSVFVMGTKKAGYLEGFLVFFGGRTEKDEPTKTTALRELKEESHGRVSCNSDDISRFEIFLVTNPQVATLFFYRCKNPTYTIGEIPHGKEIGSVVAVSVDKVLQRLPDDPNLVTSKLVADALVAIYGGGVDVEAYRQSGIMRAMRDYLVRFYYDVAENY